jgi:hypothetical protein
LVSVGNASKLINNKCGAHVLHIGIIGVGKMLGINALTVVGANTIALSPQVSKPNSLPWLSKGWENLRERKRLGT